MAKTVLHRSMSLDGFITGPQDNLEHPLGIDGRRLHDWLRAGDADPDSHRPASGPRTLVFDEMMATGAVITGRRTFDLAHAGTVTIMTASPCSFPLTQLPQGHRRGSPLRH